MFRQSLYVTDTIGKQMTTAFDYKGPSLWMTDKKLKRLKQGEDFAQVKQMRRDINEKNQVFIYSKALSRKSNGSN